MNRILVNRVSFVRIETFHIDWVNLQLLLHISRVLTRYVFTVPNKLNNNKNTM